MYGTLLIGHLRCACKQGESLRERHLANLILTSCEDALRLLNALNSEDRGLKVRFSLATIAFDRESAQMSQILSSQGKNAPSNPYPRYLVRLAASRCLFFPAIAAFSAHLSRGAKNKRLLRKESNTQKSSV